MPMTPLPLPAFQDNYIWCLAQDGEALVVDPGDATVVESWLAREGLRLTTLLITHHHPDHTGGLPALKARHQPLVLGPAEDINGIDQLLRGGEKLQLGPFGHAEVLAVPGHTRAHIAFHFPGERLLFCGDTLFSAGCGRLFEGTPEQMYTSLQAIAALPGGTRICCTHEYTLANLRFADTVEPDNADLQHRRGEAERLIAEGQPTLPVSLAEEQRYNPFLRCHEPAVIRRAAQEAGRELLPGLPTFTALRLWKDRFPA